MDNSGSGFIDQLWNFFEFLGDLLASAIYGLYMIFSSVFSALSDTFGSLKIPILPSRSKILQEGFVSGTLLVVFILYVVIINISAFNAFKADKKKAKAAAKKGATEQRSRKYERISEKKLMMKCILGGSLGGYVSMQLYHHKTLKPKFKIGVLVLLIIQLLLFSFICGFFGFWLYMS